MKVTFYPKNLEPWSDSKLFVVENVKLLIIFEDKYIVDNLDENKLCHRYEFSIYRYDIKAENDKELY